MTGFWKICFSPNGNNSLKNIILLFFIDIILTLVYNGNVINFIGGFLMKFAKRITSIAVAAATAVSLCSGQMFFGGG